MDKLSPQQRHKTMASIRGKNTKPEMIVRRWLWKRGFRYRLNSPKLPGHPDLVLRKYRTCIFVNGCFWHGHNVDLRFDDFLDEPSASRVRFTISNSDRNKERDKEEQRKLAAMGWHCITIWECELKPKVREQTLESLAFTLNHIWMKDHQVIAKPYPQFEEEEGMMKAAEE